MGRPHSDMIGFRSGKLTVITRSGTNAVRAATWEVLCDCGQTVILTTSNLTQKSKPRRSCGKCIKTAFFVGQRFAMLTLVAFAGKDPSGRTLAEWLCDCGNRRVIVCKEVSRGNYRSCNCLKGCSVKVGLTYGSLSVLEDLGVGYNPAIPKARYFKCKCTCGVEKAIQAGGLRSGATVGCGKCGTDRRWDPYRESRGHPTGLSMTPEMKRLRSMWSGSDRAVRKRDNHSCQICGAKTKLHVHHVFKISEQQELGDDPRYKITLCQDHHTEIHNRRANGPVNKRLTRFVLLRLRDFYQHTVKPLEESLLRQVLLPKDFGEG